MKKIKLLILALLSLIVLPSIVNAQNGTIRVTGSSTAIVGNKITVTVKLSAGASWEMDLNYDKNYLQLVSGGGEAGGTNMVNTSNGKPNRTYTFTFKALKKGNTTVKVGSYYVVADDFSTVNISASSKNIKIMTQEELEASYSKDNNLKSLTVEGTELTPAFNKDTLDYVVNVPEGTTSITIIALANDSKASITGDGVVNVTEGANNLSIVVRAENGSEKKYNLVVNVVDQNPINVEYSGVKYTVIKLRNNYVCPELFNDSEVTINDVVVPACFNEKINYTLVGLKKEDGTIEHFVYDNNNYTKYSEVVGTSLKLIALDYNGEFEGLEKTREKINDIEYTVFKFNNSKNFYVIYGMNVETGEKDFYSYDVKNKTFSLYNTEHIDYFKNQNKTYIYVIVAFGIGLILSLICVISLYSSKNKLKNRIKKEYKNEPPKKTKNKEKKKEIKDNILKEDINELNEIVDKEENTEIYNLFEDNKKSKKKGNK